MQAEGSVACDARTHRTRSEVSSRLWYGDFAALLLDRQPALEPAGDAAEDQPDGDAAEGHGLLRRQERGGGELQPGGHRSRRGQGHEREPALAGHRAARTELGDKHRSTPSEKRMVMGDTTPVMPGGFTGF